MRENRYLVAGWGSCITESTNGADRAVAPPSHAFVAEPLHSDVVPVAGRGMKGLKGLQGRGQVTLEEAGG